MYCSLQTSEIAAWQVWFRVLSLVLLLSTTSQRGGTLTELFAGAMKVTGSLLMYVSYADGEALQYAPQSIFGHVDGSTSTHVLLQNKSCQALMP